MPLSCRAGTPRELEPVMCVGLVASHGSGLRSPLNLDVNILNISSTCEILLHCFSLSER